MVQIPRGPDDRYCPPWRKKMSAVCHTCPMWQQFRGEDSNTGQPVDKWECSLAMAPALLIEISKHVRHGGAATESFRNEMVRLAQAGRDERLALEGR